MSEHVKSRFKQWMPLVLISLCGLLPLVSAVVLFFGDFDYSPNSKHNGTLLSPAISLLDPPQPLNTQSDDQPNNRWRLVTITSSDSHSEANDAICVTPINGEKAFLKLDQVIQALGREAHRVHRSALCISKELTLKLPKDIKANTGIIDPLNNLIMVYSDQASQKDIYQDMKRLLKYSKLG